MFNLQLFLLFSRRSTEPGFYTNSVPVNAGTGSEWPGFRRAGRNPKPWTAVVTATSITEKAELGILDRLPAKALVRCKCISKKWKRLISELCIPKYLKHPPTVCAVFVEKATETKERRKRLNYVDINEESPSKFICNMQSQLPFDHSADCLLDSSNGILLFYTPNSYQYYVCNPTTGELMLLPDECKYAVDCLATVLDFHPLESLVHFKVVSLFRLTDTKLRVEIYSSKSLKWVIFTVTLPTDPALNTWLFPLTCFKEKVYINSRCWTALCLDLTSMSISQCRLPEYGGKRSMFVEYGKGVLRASNGCLSYTATNKNNTRLRVWCYAEEYDWILMHNVGLWRIKKMIPGTGIHTHLVRVLPFCFVPSCATAYVGTRTIVFSYDLRRRKCKQVLVSLKPESLHFTHQMFSVAESRVLHGIINCKGSELASSCADQNLRFHWNKDVNYIRLLELHDFSTSSHARLSYLCESDVMSSQIFVWSLFDGKQYNFALSKTKVLSG